MTLALHVVWYAQQRVWWAGIVIALLIASWSSSLPKNWLNTCSIMKDIRKNIYWFFSEHRVVIYIAVIVFVVIFLLLSNVNSFHTDVAICVNLFIFSFFTALALLVAMVGWQERHSVSNILLHRKEFPKIPPRGNPRGSGLTWSDPWKNSLVKTENESSYIIRDWEDAYFEVIWNCPVARSHCFFSCDCVMRYYNTNHWPTEAGNNLI